MVIGVPPMATLIQLLSPPHCPPPKQAFHPTTMQPVVQLADHVQLQVPPLKHIIKTTESDSTLLALK